MSKSSEIAASVGAAAYEVSIGAASGVFDFVVDTAKGLVHVVCHPVDTATHLYEAVKRIDELPAGVQAKLTSINRGLDDRSGNLREQARFLSKEFCDVASFLTGAGGLARGAASVAGKVGSRVAGNAAAKAAAKGAAKTAVEVESPMLTFVREPSPFDVVRLKNGKTQLKVNKQRLGELHEAKTGRQLEGLGMQLKPSTFGANNGFDKVAVKYGSGGQVERVMIVECKASSTISATSRQKPSFGTLRNGERQMTNEWVASRLNAMHKQGGELQQTAELVAQNLDKTRTVLAVERQGINNWSPRAQDWLPKFDAEIVGSLLDFKPVGQ